MTRPDERTRLLVKVSTLYYIDGLNQQEISARLGISRPQVSRLLSLAKSEGIVQIRILNPFSKEQQLEKALSETFGVADVMAVSLPEQTSPEQLYLSLGQAAAALLENVIRDNDTVAVSAGRSIAAVAEALSWFPRKNVTFVPAVGGWGTGAVRWHANSNARTMGEKLHGKCLFLNAPAIVGTKETRDAIMREKEIAGVLDRARKADLAVVGIGQVSEEAAIVRSGFFGREELEEVRRLGAVANLNTSFMDADGNVLEVGSEARMIGLSADELRKIPKVIAVAGGEDKVVAITALLRGRWIDSLITDVRTAERILAHHRQKNR